MNDRVLLSQRDLERDSRARRKRREPEPLERRNRPKTRADCKDGCRPCPWVGCRYHLFLDVTAFGSIRLPHGDEVDELEKMPATCALDVADKGGLEMVDISKFFGISTWGLRLVAYRAMAVLSERRKLQELSPFGPRHVWEKGVSQTHAPRTRKDCAEAIRAFLDAPLERKETAP